jgi:hypothetical protein
VTLRDLGFYFRGRVNSGVSRVLNAGRRGVPPPAPLPLADALRAAGSALALVPLLEGRSNAEREAAVASYLEARGIEFVRQRFASFEGRGENFSVDIGGGDRTPLLTRPRK